MSFSFRKRSKARKNFAGKVKKLLMLNSQARNYREKIYA